MTFRLQPVKAYLVCGLNHTLEKHNKTTTIG
jgi:hypothetical protein